MADIKEAEINHQAANVAVPTTSETVIVTSPKLTLPFHTCRTIVLAWGQLTTGTGTTAVTPRIRRGTTNGDPLVGEANGEQVKVAAGNTEPFFICVSEALEGKESVQYCFTLAQTGATADGTCVQAAILTLIL